jgi:hypothetical protein
MGSDPIVYQFGTTELGLTAFRELVMLATVLLEDSNTALVAARERGEHRFRRSFVRAAFAYFDGVTYAMKQLALVDGEAGFSAAEKSLLAEKTFELDDKGRAFERQTKLRTLPNLRFAFSSLSRALDRKVDVDFACPGWVAMHEALRIRHRVTHPKSVKSIELSEADVQTVNIAGEWFTASWKHVLTGVK